MRIGIDIRALQEGRTTGVQVYITNLLRALFELDSENQYFLFANGFKDIKSRLPEFKYPNVRILAFNYPNKLFMFSQVFFNWPKVDKMLGGVDLFFSPHWRRTALGADVPLVVTFHDLSFEIMPEFFTLRRRFWHKLMGYRAAARRAQMIAAVSESTKRDIVDLYGIPEEKVQVIYPGAGSAAVAADGSGEYFLYFGTFEPRKNIKAVIAAYEEYVKSSKNPKKLVLAGSVGWKTKIPKTARVLQNVSEEEKIKLYDNAFALLFVSFYEGFGFPVLEAASMGIPVISSFATSLSEIGQEFALFVNPFRPSQIAQAMLELENDRDLYARLSVKGIETAKKFSWGNTARETLELFQKICV